MRRTLAVLALFALAVLAACASGGSASDDAKRGGFYGGISGGMSRVP